MTSLPTNQGYVRDGSVIEGEPLRPKKSGTSYTPVESVRRALEVLKCLNELGVAKVHQLSHETGVHKATMVRMLETLMAEGYVTRDECLGGYCVTSKVKVLSAGFSGRPRVIEAAREHILDLTKRVGWPVGLASIDDGRIILNFSTDPVSHWPYPFSVIGQTMDLLNSALGRVSLAYCSTEDLEDLIEVKRAQMGQGRKTFKSNYVAPIIERTLAQGYAVSLPVHKHSRHRFTAVPLIIEGRFVAALGMGFYTSAVTTKAIQGQLVSELQKTAANIEQGWNADPLDMPK